jgi:hypothetical protein
LVCYISLLSKYEEKWYDHQYTLRFKELFINSSIL